MNELLLGFLLGFGLGVVAALALASVWIKKAIADEERDYNRLKCELRRMHGLREEKRPAWLSRN